MVLNVAMRINRKIFLISSKSMILFVFFEKNTIFKPKTHKVQQKKPLMSREKQLQISKIYEQLAKKYKAEPRKLNFNCDLSEQLYDLMKKIRKTAQNNLFNYQRSMVDESTDDFVLLNSENESYENYESESSEEIHSEDENEFSSESSAEEIKAVVSSSDSNDDSGSNEETKTPKKKNAAIKLQGKEINPNLMTASEIISCLEKPTASEFEMSDEIESDYLEHLKD
ncbi:hypothetical protein M153_7140002402 [Pseudoloma neurophilia]|uniref:Uncharacterized protein n=1 Tax=Pseudoloma neurophilia TaxID=146866 RepID=A0A0R0LW88_9MICR|nr:hypothetical protein M153_7140002402 [Pseudoloma neurophilia]